MYQKYVKKKGTQKWGNNFTLSPQKVSQVALFSTTHFESLCFVCVYTSFSFGFYQSCAAVFAESAFFIMAQFQEVAVSPGSLSEASSIVFVAFTFVLLGFFASLVYLVLPCSVFYIFALFWIYLFIFFLSGFFFTNIHDSRDSRGRGRVSI